jgi:rhodanese-related sulfurtransferase
MITKHALFSLALALSFVPAAALACDGHDKETASTAPYGEVGLDEVARLVQTKSATIVDANKAERYAAGHIPGAIHTRADDNGKLTGAALPADKATKLVFYCHSEKCQASHMAAKAAVDVGYTNVFVFPAGITGWEKAGKATEKPTAAKPAAKGQG